jgi:hypothetical protein
MRDSIAREKIAEMKVQLDNLLQMNDGIQGFKDYRRRFVELARELGLEFDEDGILNREAAMKSSLGRLQTQITALVEAIGHKETYVEGVLRYEKTR